MSDVHRIQPRVRELLREFGGGIQRVRVRHCVLRHLATDVLTKVCGDVLVLADLHE